MDKLKKAMLRAEREAQAKVPEHPAPAQAAPPAEPAPLSFPPETPVTPPVPPSPPAAAPEPPLEPWRLDLTEPPKERQPRARPGSSPDAHRALPADELWEQPIEPESPLIPGSVEPEGLPEEIWDIPDEVLFPETASRGGILELLDLEEAAEPLRVLRAQILSRTEALGGTSLLVTSANPGEGKSFTALALAATIAEQGDRAAVLVEADLKAPSLLPRFGLEATEGLSDYLLGAAELEQVLVDSGYENLTLLPAGAPPPDGADLLGTSRLKTAFSQLRSRRTDGFLIVDGPSLLSGADAVLLSLLVDAVLLVVEAEVTPEADLLRAVEALGGRPVVGIVYNKSRG